MPTTRRRRRRELVEHDGLTEGAYEFFARGAYFDEAREFEAKTTEDERAAFWKKHKVEILERFMGEMRRNGKWYAGWRPDYFWQELEEQGQERRKIGTQSYWGPWGSDGEPGPPKKERVYDLFENDWMYLHRLGLLEPWEVEVGDPDRGQGKFE